MWRNFRKNEEIISKRLDQLLVSKDLLDQSFLVKSNISSGGILNHLPVLLELTKEDKKSIAPLKFNHTWIMEEYYIKMVEEA
jgi:hypothetical protein